MTLLPNFKFDNLELFKLSKKLNEAKVDVTNIMSEKNEVLKAIDSRTKDFVEVSLKKLKLNSELSEVRIKLHETKVALNKITVPKKDKLENIIKNLKVGKPILDKFQSKNLVNCKTKLKPKMSKLII